MTDSEPFNAHAWIDKAMHAGMQPQLLIMQDGQHRLSCLTPQKGGPKAPARPRDGEHLKAVYEALKRKGRITDYRQ